MTEARYDVVVLVERELATTDAQRLAGLHEGVDETVRYHLLLPVEDPVAAVEMSVGQLTMGEAVSTPVATVTPEVAEELRHDLLGEAERQVTTSVRRLEATGAEAVGVTVTTDPMRALADRVAEVDAREAVVLTRPHLVRELLRLDWTSRAERRLDVPVLHLLDHTED